MRRTGDETRHRVPFCALAVADWVYFVVKQQRCVLFRARAYRISSHLSLNLSSASAWHEFGVA